MEMKTEKFRRLRINKEMSSAIHRNSFRRKWKYFGNIFVSEIRKKLKTIIGMFEHHSPKTRNASDIRRSTFCSSIHLIYFANLPQSWNVLNEFLRRLYRAFGVLKRSVLFSILAKSTLIRVNTFQGNETNCKEIDEYSESFTINETRTMPMRNYQSSWSGE